MHSEICSVDRDVCLCLYPSLCFSLLLVDCFSPPNNQTICIYNHGALPFFIHTLDWLQTLQRYIIPFFIIFTLNDLTLRLISLSNRVHAPKVKSKIPPRNDYSIGTNVAAYNSTMLCLSNAAAIMDLYECTQGKFRQEVFACVRCSPLSAKPSVDRCCNILIPFSMNPVFESVKEVSSV